MVPRNIWLPNRRQVISTALGSAALVGCGVEPLDPGNTGMDAGRDAGMLGMRDATIEDAALADAGQLDVGQTDAGMVDSGAPTCSITGPDILGPKYREDAPFRYQIADATEPGERLFVNGRVTGRDCTGLAGAILEVWQADDVGVYDDFSPEFRLRGRANIDASGDYGFETIMPGIYLGRPRHLHFMVRHQRGGQELAFITQMYFEGDPNLANEPPASHERAIPTRTMMGAQYGLFDLVLDV